MSDADVERVLRGCARLKHLDLSDNYIILDSATATAHFTGKGIQGCAQLEYAPRAVQFHPHGGRFDFVWLPARTPHVGPQYAWCLTAERNQEKKNAHPKNVTALVRVQDAEPL